MMKYLSNVATLALDASRCNGCRMCVTVCPHAVFAMQKKKSIIVDKDACMECGACARNCARGAITVRAGVGCAAAVINGIVRKSEPTCDCGEGDCCG
ncbi:MAG: mercury methylation ferredoxin HgcB [Spirochaetota bacterium]